jgi:sterol desaturase/sphingolipid hydroxylase (fatty acid hydroxylase superfamily)
MHRRSCSLMMVVPPPGEDALGLHSSDNWVAAPRPHEKRKKKTQPHLMPGPVMLSWSAGLGTLALQVLMTDWAQLTHDAEYGFGWLIGDPAGQVLALFSTLALTTLGSSFFMMEQTFPPEMSPVDAGGERHPLRVPRRSQGMEQHQLNRIDYSYMLLNALCMPGLFYSFVGIMRSWGFNPAAPPLFGIYPDVSTVPGAQQMLTQTLPQGAFALALYFVSYEFIYYWWHRAMHEVPALYTWIHRHHHQQTYPDRPAIDTLNTHCVESQVGLYMQLVILVAWDKILHIASLPAGIWFFTIAGYLSVLEHDSAERSLLYNFWRADEHHMHHAFVRCNYSPYSTLWDKVFGTHMAFSVKGGGKGATRTTAEKKDDDCGASATETTTIGSPGRAPPPKMSSPSLSEGEGEGREGDPRPSGNNRALGYCDEDDVECQLSERVAQELNPISGEESVRMRGLAVGYASLATVTLFLLALFKTH